MANNSKRGINMKNIDNSLKIWIGLAALAVVGTVIGVLLKMPLLITILLMPILAFEIYKPQGKDTGFSCWALLILLILEAISIIFNIRINIAGTLGITKKQTANAINAFGRIDIYILLGITYYSFKLFFKAAGLYLKLLAVIVFAGSLACVYTVDPKLYQKLAYLFSDQVLGRIRFIVKLLGL